MVYAIMGTNEKIIQGMMKLQNKTEGANGMLDGKVVLMHSTKDSTVEAMKTVVPWLIDEGHQLVTVTDLARYGYDTEMKAGKDYGYKFFTGLGAAKQE